MRSTLAVLLAAVALAACGDPLADADRPDPPALNSLPDFLPHSMKGYVLYAWERDGRTWFTLITGTNRLKSFDELDEAKRLVGEDGWVRVRVSGVAAARDLLRRVPADTSVMVDTIRAPSVAQNTIPDDVGEADPETLASLRGTRPR